MKKTFILFALGLFSVLGIQAQESVPAKPMSRNELQEALAPLIQKLQAIPDDSTADQKVKDATIAFINENHNDAGLYATCAILPQVMEDEEFESYVNANEFLKSNEKVQKMIDVIKVKKNTGEGNMFVDFSAEYEGKTTKLSDYVGKGQFVLVDFWASWCGPCKAEIPNLIKAYNTHKSDRFTVLGVATWDKPENTLKAMEQLGIPYPQIMNAQTAGSDAYGIQGIPEIILFGPDGTILKRGLRGEAIEQALSEYLK